LPKLFIWRRVVLIKITRTRWSFSEAIKRLIATKNPLWVFSEDAGYNVCPEALFLKRL
jgi:predicted CopG family antitoxin